MTLLLGLYWLSPTICLAQTELEQAHAAYKEAFQRYSEAALSASGSEEDFDQLFKDYRAAYARYKALKSKQPNTQAKPEKKVLDTSGIDGITSLSEAEACASVAFKEVVAEAENLRNQGKYQQALEQYRSAHKACPDKNIEEAMAWLMAQTEPEPAKPISATEKTADHYQYGVGVPIDHEKAIQLYQQQDNAQAWLALANYYQQGIWLKQDNKKAKRLLKKAAKAGLIEAQWQLDYEQGEKL